MLILDPSKKLIRDVCKKNYHQKNDRKIELLTFITVCKSFQVNFLHFFISLISVYVARADSNSASNFAFMNQY
jgi:hypothetical protein